MIARRLILAAGLLLAAFAPAPGLAQQAADAAVDRAADTVANAGAAAAADAGGAPHSALLTIDPERLYQQSLWGQRAQADWTAASAALLAENDRLTAELSAAEQDLTRLRTELEPKEFRRRAAAFDARVSEVRQAQDAKGRALTTRAEAEREAFFSASIGAFAQVMEARGAVAILDRQSVFVSSGAIDVTADLVAAVDQIVGDGVGQAEARATLPQPADGTNPAPPDTPPEPGVDLPLRPPAEIRP